MFIINFLQNVSPSIFKYEPDLILRKLKQDITEKIQRNECSDEVVDVHELLKNEIGVSTEDIRVESDTDFSQTITNNFASSVDIASILGSKTFTDLKNIFSPTAAIKNKKILLDTRYRVLDNDGRTIIKWNYANNTSTTQGSTNAVGDIQNIVSVRVFPFQMPYLKSADNEYKRITMYIQEFSAQSVIAQENRNYHFMFETEVNDRYINLNLPRSVDGIYKFTNPITRLDSVNISFGSPLEQVTFDTDRRTMLAYTYGTTTSFQSVENHNLETGDRVYISNFTTTNPLALIDSNIISAINRTNGQTVTYIDDTTISIDVNTSQLNFTGPGTITATNGSTSITGVLTTFLTTFVIGDVINILGFRYIIATITDNTTLTITQAYAETTGAGLAYSKNNPIPNLNASFYYGSKRMFIELEFEYMEASS
ncbi:MAG: hypothetical protein ACRCZI_02585 [Cetobacterium sp.]